MNSTPLYQQIERTLRSRISTAEPGDLLPSEPALAIEFGVARMTVRAAVTRLEAEGLVERVPGRGTFARRPPMSRPAGTLMSFRDQVAQWGQQPTSTVVEAQLRSATDEEAAALLIDSASLPASVRPQVVSIIRVRRADGVAIAVERARFPADLAFLLDEDLSQASIHATLTEHGVTPVIGRSTITAELAGDDGELLTVDAATPVLVETRVILDGSGRPVEFTESRYLAAKYALHVTFDVSQTANERTSS